MADLFDETEEKFVKMMLIGDSGAGKTGALASLAAAGYKLRIVDMDNGIAPLREIIKKQHPGVKIDVQFETFRDEFKATAFGTSLVMPAKAYMKASQTMNKWTDGTKPSEWGSEYIYIVDSFTLLCQAARNQAESLAPNVKDPRQWFYSAQQAGEHFLAAIFGPNFKTNVIVLTHITDIEQNDGTKRGFPSAIGQALSRHIAKYLNDLFIVETKGQGSNRKRIIRTVPNGQTDAKSAALSLPSELPVESGLATIFETLKNI